MKTLTNTFKNIFTLSVLFFALIFTKNVSAQFQQQWVKQYTYQSYREDFLYDMAVDKDGNIFVTGESGGSTTGFDYGTVKYTPDGTQNFAVRYNGLQGDKNDRSYAVATDNLGNSFVTGLSENPGKSGNDIATVKYNSMGTEIWVKVYTSDGIKNDKANDVFADNAGNVYVTGLVTSTAGHLDMITIKYNSSGIQQWAKQYHSGGSNSDVGNAVIVDALGNVYVAGTAYGNAVVVKYNSAGTQLWATTYNGPGNAADNFWCIAVDASGNVYAAGESAVGVNDYDYSVVKFNSAGVITWSKNYAGPGAGDDKVKGLKIDAAGNVYVTGESKGSNTNKDYATIKYNSSGTQLWASRYNGADNLLDEGYALAVDSIGNVYVTGKSYSNATEEDFATVKYNSNGAQQWVMKYDGPANSEDYGKCISIDKFGNIVVSGISHEDAGSDYCTIKYSSMTGMQIVGGEILKSFGLSQNYPNPFNPVTNINFSLPANATVKLVVYDMTGKELSVLVNEQLNAGTYKFDFDASHLSSGTYFYKLTAGDFSEVKKMILVK